MTIFKTTFFILFTICIYSFPLLADTVVGEPPPASNSAQLFITLALGALLVYFVLLRPEQRKQKALTEQRNSLKSGDRVIAAGIIGTVFAVKENTIVLKMYDGSKIEFIKNAIQEVLPNNSQEVLPPIS